MIGLANDSARNDGATICSIGAISSLDQSQSTVPLLAHLVDDFLKRYDRVALPTELHRWVLLEDILQAMIFVITSVITKPKNRLFISIVRFLWNITIWF